MFQQDGKIDVCVDTNSISAITEPDSTEPCEPGTNVLLQGIVWTETDSGVLVVNVTWRGKTYVGTLLDATKQEWAAPRVECESPAIQADEAANTNHQTQNTTTISAKSGKNKRTTNNSNQLSPSSNEELNTIATMNNNEDLNEERKLVVNARNDDLNSKNSNNDLLLINENTFTPPPIKKYKTKASNSTNEEDEEKKLNVNHNSESNEMKSQHTENNDSVASLNINNSNVEQSCSSHQPSFVSKQCIVQSNGVVFPPVASENDYKEIMNKQQQQQLEVGGGSSLQQQLQQQQSKQKLHHLSNSHDARKSMKKQKKSQLMQSNGISTSLNNELDSINQNESILNLSGSTNRLVDNGSPAYSDISDATNDNKNEEKLIPASNQSSIIPILSSNNPEPNIVPLSSSLRDSKTPLSESKQHTQQANLSRPNSTSSSTYLNNNRVNSPFQPPNILSPGAQKMNNSGLKSPNTNIVNDESAIMKQIAQAAASFPGLPPHLNPNAFNEMQMFANVFAMNSQLNPMMNQHSGNPNDQAFAQFFALNAAQQFANMAQMSNPDFLQHYQQELANQASMNKPNNFSNPIKTFDQSIKYD